MVNITEGKKMFWSVTAIFAVYAVVFILFEDYDRRYMRPFAEASDWHLLIFSVVVLGLLSLLLLRYARRMDERIHRERMEKQALMRRELTQNIAHELKTPVAGILGYTETLIDHPDIDAQTRDQFIERTHVQAQRLAKLLEDLSVLNRMDYAAEALSKELVDVSSLVADIVADSQLRAESRRMKIRNCLPQDIMVRGNSLLIGSIFSNLIDNSINYAGSDATMELSASYERGLWHFVFSDNGVGIPQEHLSRIFERFYRVDKGRSRSLGGTGLGLAIVKNAVLLHGGSISVSSPPEGGLSFHFTLKR